MQALVILDHTRRLPKQLIMPVRARLHEAELEKLDDLIATLKPTLLEPSPSKPTPSQKILKAETALPKASPPKPSRAVARAKSSPPSARTGNLLSFLNDSPVDSDYEPFEGDVFGDDFEEESQEGQLNTWRSEIRRHGRVEKVAKVAYPIRGILIPNIFRVLLFGSCFSKYKHAPAFALFCPPPPPAPLPHALVNKGALPRASHTPRPVREPGATRAGGGGRKGVFLKILKRFLITKNKQTNKQASPGPPPTSVRPPHPSTPALHARRPCHPPPSSLG